MGAQRKWGRIKRMVYIYILKLVCYSIGISTGKGMFMMRKNNRYARNNKEQEDTQTR